MKVSFAIIAKFFRRFDELFDQIQSLSKKGPEFEIILVLDKGHDKEFASDKYNSATKFGRELNGSFSRMRNFAIDMCRGDWIFHIDTDELLPDFFVKEYEKTFWDVVNASKFDVLGFPRINDFTDPDKKESTFKYSWPDFQWRLHKKLPGIRFHNDVHEMINFHGFPYTKGTFEPVDYNAIRHIKYLKEIHESDRIYKEIFNQKEDPISLS